LPPLAISAMNGCNAALQTLADRRAKGGEGRSTAMAYSFMNIGRQGWTRRSVRQLPLPAGVSSWSSADPDKPYSNGGKAHYIANLQMEHPVEL